MHSPVSAFSTAALTECQGDYSTESPGHNSSSTIVGRWEGFLWVISCSVFLHTVHLSSFLMDFEWFFITLFFPNSVSFFWICLMNRILKRVLDFLCSYKGTSLDHIVIHESCASQTRGARCVHGIYDFCQTLTSTGIICSDYIFTLFKPSLWENLAQSMPVSRFFIIQTYINSLQTCVWRFTKFSWVSGN